MARPGNRHVPILSAHFVPYTARPIGTGMPYQTNFEVQLQIELVVHCSTQQSEAPYESLLTRAIERYTLEPFSKEVISVKSC